ncbi:hypothetical protein B0H14DRAFT_2654468 [Mycena olivaceomarginata]|nr:hypothetical protein B0H14DRAFT_2654468 [Mycena olivaceomarginata]
MFFDGHNLVFHRDGTGEITSWGELCVGSSPSSNGRFTVQPVEYNSPTTGAALLYPNPRFALPTNATFITGGINRIYAHKRRPRPIDPQRLLNEDLYSMMPSRRASSISCRARALPLTAGLRRHDVDVVPVSAFVRRVSVSGREAWRAESHNMVDSVGQPNMRRSVPASWPRWIEGNVW